MKTSKEYKDAALSRIRGNWSPILVASVIYILAILLFTGGEYFPRIFNSSAGVQASSAGVSTLLVVFVVIPLSIGFSNACRVLYERNDLNMASNMWNFSINNYLHKLLGGALMTVKIMLWTLLLVVPGSVMAFAYAMTPYILEEHPEISAWDASTESRNMMRGHKTELFMLYLSFIGWFILACLTLGIGFIWLQPYVQTAEAAFYNDLKGGDGNPVIIVE